MATSLLDKLMEEGKCLSCSCRIEPPLMKCTYGHHFCGECNESPETCPLCEYPTKRDRLIERLFLTDIKCPFVKSGCEFTGKPAEIAVHGSSCLGSPTSCLDHSTNSESIENIKDEVSKKKCIDDDSTKTLEDAIVAEIQCPVCLLRLSPPMIECGNGHLICHRCMPQMERCPICRDSNTISSNTFLQSVFHMLELSCINECNGCKVRGKSSSILNHEEMCEYVMISCPLTTSHRCSWIGLGLQFLDHFRSVHFEDLGMSLHVTIPNDEVYRNHGEFLYDSFFL